MIFPSTLFLQITPRITFWSSRIWTSCASTSSASIGRLSLAGTGLLESLSDISMASSAFLAFALDVAIAQSVFREDCEIQSTMYTVGPSETQYQHSTNKRRRTGGAYPGTFR